MKKLILISFIVLHSIQTFGQKVRDLDYGQFMMLTSGDSTNYFDYEKGLDIYPKYGISYTNAFVLYDLKGKELFRPNENFKNVFFEIYNDELIVITAFPDELADLSMLYRIAKHKIGIIPLADLYSYYEANVEGKDILAIDLNCMTVYVEDKEKMVKKEIKLIKRANN